MVFVDGIVINTKENKILFENNTFVQPKPNMCILFPGSVLHYVPKTKGNRILMSYNLLV